VRNKERVKLQVFSSSTLYGAAIHGVPVRVLPVFYKDSVKGVIMRTILNASFWKLGIDT
jgi:hypothetical protein